MKRRVALLGLPLLLITSCGSISDNASPDIRYGGKIILEGRYGETTTYTLNFNKDGGTYKYDCKNDDQLEADYKLAISIPVVIRTCQNYYTRTDAVYAIYMHDGPFYGSLIDRLDQHNLPLMHGFVIVEPRYPGSKERPWQVSPSAPDFATFETSRSELLALIAHYRSIDRKFILVGDGFGGLIIASLLNELRKDESVILYTPVLSASEPEISDVIASNSDLKRDYAATCKAVTKLKCGDRREWVLKNVYQGWRDFSAISGYAKTGFAPKIWLVSGDSATASSDADAKAFAAAFPKSVKLITIPKLTRDGFINVAQFNQAQSFLRPILLRGNLKDNDK